MKILLAITALCVTGSVGASPDPKVLVSKDSLTSLEMWALVRQSDTSVDICFSHGNDKGNISPNFFVRKLNNITKETSDSTGSYRLNYDLIDNTTCVLDIDARVVHVTRTVERKIRSIRRITADTPAMEITEGAITFLIPYRASGIQRAIMPNDKVPHPHIQEQYEIPANTYNQFRKMYQQAYISQGFVPFAFTVNVSPLASYRANFINEAQFTHAAEQQTRATDERPMYGTALEAHAGLAFRNHMPYVSFIHLRSGFHTESSRLMDWKAGLASGKEVGSQQNLSYQNGFGIGYYVSGYGRRLFNACFDGELYYLWVSKYRSRGTIRDTVFTGATSLRDIGVRPHQLGVKLAAGISIRPNYALDFHIMPTLYCNVSSFNKASILRSNFVSYGVTAGFTYRWMKQHYKDPVWYRRR